MAFAFRIPVEEYDEELYTRGCYFYREDMTAEDRKQQREKIHHDNDPARFYDMPDKEREQLLEWVKAAFTPRKTPNTSHSSYGLKHSFESAVGGGFYVTNGQFKGAMIAAGFEPVDDRDSFGKKSVNDQYGISERSPLFKRDDAEDKPEILKRRSRG